MMDEECATEELNSKSIQQETMELIMDIYYTLYKVFIPAMLLFNMNFV